MDFATIVGFILGTALLLGAIMIDGPLGPFIHIPSFCITVGGAFTGILINFPIGNGLNAIAVIKQCFLVKLPTEGSVIEQFKEFAATTRRDGL
ncbi:MAG: motility protein A, partial [Planctomycetaceae bacterium]|nr:motility protein A [Planctomycetaceae bacterium]